MAFSTFAAKRIAVKLSHPGKLAKNFVKKDIMITGSKKELAEKAAAAPLVFFQSLGENTFNFKENPDSLLGFDINLTKKAKVIGATGIVGSTIFDVATMQTNNIGPTENGIKTATPTLNEYFDQSYIPSYANSNADGDLVLALNKNRNG